TGRPGPSRRSGVMQHDPSGVPVRPGPDPGAGPGPAEPLRRRTVRLQLGPWRVVDSPAPPDVDPVVGQVVGLVVADRGVRHVGREDRRGLLVVGTHPGHVVVADGDVLVGHLWVARVVRVRLDPAGHDPGAGVAGERVAGDGDAAGAEPGAAGRRVSVVPHAQPDLAEPGERVAAEGDVAGRGDLHRRGRLRPLVTGGLEERATGTAGAQPVRGHRVAADDVRAVLLVRVAVGTARAEPGSPGELHVAELQPGDRAAVTAADIKEGLQPRQFDVEIVRVLPRLGLVVEAAGGGVQVPLAGLLQEGVIVLQVHGAAGERGVDRTVAPGVVVPGGLLHDDAGAADRGDRRVPVGEGVDALHLDLALVRRGIQIAEGRAGDGQPGLGEGEIGAGHLDRRPGRFGAVHVQLA